MVSTYKLSLSKTYQMFVITIVCKSVKLHRTQKSLGDIIDDLEMVCASKK